jgi:hypothetical protein
MTKKTIIIIVAVLVIVMSVIIYTAIMSKKEKHKIRKIFERSNTQIWVTIGGLHDVKIGDYITIGDTNGKYDGQYIVKDVIKENGTTSIAVGLTYKDKAEHKAGSGMIWADYINKSGYVTFE